MYLVVSCVQEAEQLLIASEMILCYWNI